MLSDGQLQAAVLVQQLSPSLGQPQPVGTTITWKATATDTNPGTLKYQFSVQSPGGDFAVLRDFSASDSFEWTPSEHEGDFQILVKVRNDSTLEVAQLTASYTVSPRVTGSDPVVSVTANPLVALYSAPACDAGGSMRVRFWRDGDPSSKTTSWKNCRQGASMNFYVAGMLANTLYKMQHEFIPDAEAPVTAGPTLSFTTGTPAGAFPTTSVVLAHPGTPGQDVLLHTFVGQPSRFFSATNLNGQLLWYYGRTIVHATEPCDGGRMLVHVDGLTLRVIDLAGNTVRETHIKAVADQILARGQQPPYAFHHDARCLPNGNIVALTYNERTLSDVQGPGPVTITGDMIVVLDKNWQVTWTWDGFDHLDVTQKAILDEKCASCSSTGGPANDWLHSNSVTYSPADGNLLLSVRHLDWVIKLDYRDGIGTGAVVWRLGKNGDFTTDSTDLYPWFSHQHDAEYEPGDPQTITVFDNGNTRRFFPHSTANSRGQVWKLDEANRTASLQLNADLGGYSAALGGAQRLADGNYHFLSGFLAGSGRSIEVGPDGALRFILQIPALTYRSFRMRDLYTSPFSSQAGSGDTQTISFDAVAGKTYGDGPFDVSATASSGLPVSFQVVSGPATISGNTVTITGGGAVVLQADQSGNARYNPARSVRQSFVVAKVSQAITVGTHAPSSAAYNSTFDVSATSDSGLPVTYSSSGACTNNGATFTMTGGTGVCTVKYEQAGDSNYNVAAALTETVTAQKVGQTITFGALAGKTYGDADFTVSATATSGLPVSFAASGDCTVSGSTVHITGVGSCEITASQSGDSNFNAAADVQQSFQIAKANQTITFDAPTGKTFGDADFDPGAAASSGLPVSYTAAGDCSFVSGKVRILGAGSCTVTAKQAGDSNYNAAPDVPRSFNVAKANTTTTVTAGNAVFDGNPHGGTASVMGPAGLNQTLTVSYTGRNGTAYGPSATAPTNAGDYTASANYAGDSNYNPSSDTEDFRIAKADQTITFNSISDKTFGDADFGVSAAASSGLSVSFAASGNCTISGSTVHITGAGSCTVTASQAGNSNYNAVSDVQRSFKIAKASQSITFGELAAKTYGDAPFGVSATGGASTSPVTFTSRTPADCSVSGSTVTILGAGSCTVRASQAGDANYNAAADVDRTFNVAKAGSTTNVTAADATFDGQPHGATATATGFGGLNQSLTVTYTGRNATTYGPSTTPPTNAGDYTAAASFAGDADHDGSSDSKNFQITKALQTIIFGALGDKTYGDAPFVVGATGGASGSPVTFAATGNCTSGGANGSTITINGAGSCTVTASQGGNSNYHAAADVQQSFQIAKANQTITFNNIPDKTFGDADFGVSAAASSGLSVSFAASGDCTVLGGMVHILGAGSCTVTAKQGGDSNYNPAPDVQRSFNVAKADTTTSVTAGNAVFDGQPHGGTASVTGTAGLNQSLTVSYAGRNGTAYGPSTTAPTNAGDYTASASYAGDSNYKASSGSKDFSITKASQTITFNAIPDKTFGDADFDPGATASSGLPVVYSATGNCAILGGKVNINGAGSCTVTAKQDGDSNYSAATDVSRTFTIDKVGQTITFGALADKTYGDAPFTLSATGGESGNPVTFASQTPTVCSVSVDTVTIQSAGTCTLRASQAGGSNYDDAASVDRSFQVARAATETSVTSSPNPSGVGQSVVYTATVTSASVVPAGVVRFLAGGVLYGPTGVPCVAGVGNVCTAELRAAPLPAGNHAITAEFLDNANFLASTGALAGGQTIVAGGLFEFSQATYTVAERGGSVTVRVVRNGDPALPVTVDYATDDGGDPSVSVPCSATTGAALDRCDYGRALGTLKFAAGERERSFTVLVNDDSFVEGGETARLRLSNPTGGSVLGSLTAATLEITDDPTESSVNVIDENQKFVTQHYRDFLNREPDAEGLAFWTAQMTDCGSPNLEVCRVNVSAAFFQSIEFQNTGYLVERMYKAAYGELTGNSNLGGPHTLGVPRLLFHEFQRDTQQIRQDVIVGRGNWQLQLEENKAAFARDFVLRPEFLARYPGTTSAAAFVNSLDANAGGVLDDAEKSALIGELSPDPADRALRASVVRKVAEDADLVRSESNRAFVLMEYFGYLRRNPRDAPDADYTGYDFWLQKLNQFGGDFVAAEMVKAFLSSDEYRKRFGQ
ncbi:MAG TPA: aryl-sulfate sulfotransferase [Pyrinomonadaceae bacterium]|nr:aryl-sulfate sulfotransferase [Pyrinomonadaceae bacterium]